MAYEILKEFGLNINNLNKYELAILPTIVKFALESDKYKALGNYSKVKEDFKELALRANSARKPGKEALNAYSLVLKKIKDLLETTYLSGVDLAVSSYFKENGGIIVKENNLYDILMNEDIANFKTNNRFALWLLEDVKTARVMHSPTDFFNHITSHEYGHVWLNHLCSNAVIPFQIPNEIGEAFSFLFSDMITNFETNMDNMSKGYQRIMPKEKAERIKTHYYALKIIIRDEGIKKLTGKFWQKYAKNN